MIELTLCTWLRELPGVISVVPNVFAISLPETELFPALRVSRISNTLGQTFDGLTGEETATIQIDYWAKQVDEIKAIKKVLITFFNELSSNQESILSVHNLREQPSYEPKSKAFKQTLELTISYKL
ncbi:MAG TPA: hypothetical protein EYN67_19350 [Flavobacteriales bacterium]|nr:hypothetical protein [Methylococcaceae bacterium]HHZ97644.1 hypothetical protein [Flavobacteriales bacterium]